MNVFIFMRVWLFAGSYVYAISVLLAVGLRGAWEWNTVVLTFVVLPLLDLFGARYHWNPSDTSERDLARRRTFRWLTWSWVPVGLGLTGYVLMTIAHSGTPWVDRIALAGAVGLMNGVIGITYAHELVHQSSRCEQRLGETLLVLVTYAHWRIEHVFGHHRHVATPLDPASSHRGESFYAFLPRSVAGGLLSAWRIESARLERAGRPVWSRENRMLQYAVVSLGVYAAVAAFAGAAGVMFFALQSVVAFVSLETINYIEHYGLVRAELGPGRYEATRPRHSWNAPHRFSNFLLINLARHSDHHASASRRYQILRTYDEREVPELPQGYNAMYLLALMPPLWFRVMDPRVERWNAREAVA